MKLTARLQHIIFPMKKEEVLKKWTQFGNRKDWKPSSCSILCEKHFKEEFITRGKRNTLKWNLDSVPTIHSRIALKRPSLLPNVPDLRKQPKVRIVQPDQMSEFHTNERSQKKGIPSFEVEGIPSFVFRPLQVAKTRISNCYIRRIYYCSMPLLLSWQRWYAKLP